ncbi:serine/threonine protein kinase [Cnuibacter physcomitrellae]|uniref:non-specific serine/threonine protein kinase n=1 Tax=Cnuibacter physcomitrellae TaxID=1619308 RepID=A0A1X9LQ84_9MICO|nr:serine/threonine protein kinase [Cnuibacter physcomitrellae]
MTVARRLPSPPPTLPGFTSVRVLGSGGFADVYLFEQTMPRRQVAVKVMLPETVDDAVRRMFRAEADLMARLSAHPSILTVYEAGVSGDGRPYLVMELCSSSLGQRYRTAPLPVAEVLRIGVKIAGALHTAHQEGILHRDVKPSNILVTAYGAPVLSDFGIASTTRASHPGETVGLSIPWSAPEVVSEETTGTVASEVWSLGATLYSLLAGRSPFEEPGRSLPPGELVRRITRAKPARIGRDDVPEALARCLARTLSKNPAARPASALELLRELQGIETSLGLTQTAAEVAVAEWATDYARDTDDRTVLSTPPAGGTVPSRRRRRHPTAPSVGAVAQSASHDSDRTHVARGGAAPRSRRAPLLLGAGALAVVALGAGGLILAQQAAQPSIPKVGEITARVEGDRLVFSWADPGLTSQDSYRVATRDGVTSVQRTAEFSADATAGGSVCISVAVLRAGRAGEPSAEKCASVP